MDNLQYTESIFYKNKEENEIEDLNVEADRVIAMNPSGVIENFAMHEENVNGKKIRCDGDSCVILGDANECENGICNKSSSYSFKYIIYLIIFLALCALGYFLYKKYYKCDS